MLRQVSSFILMAALAACQIANIESYADAEPGGGAAQALATDGAVYTDALAPAWVDWSWGVKTNFDADAPANGVAALRVDYQSAWAGLLLGVPANFDTHGFSSLNLSARRDGGSGTYDVTLLAEDGSLLKTVALTASPAWAREAIALADLGADGRRVSGLIVQGRDDAPSTLFLDDIAFGQGDTPPPPPSTPPPTPPPAPPPAAKSETIAPAAWSGPLSDAEALAHVRPAPETIPANRQANARVATAGELAPMATIDAWTGVDPRALVWQKQITGNPGRTLTTDELIQWAAWKWGFDEDLVRAVAFTESNWQQSAAGNWTTNLADCPAGGATRTDSQGRVSCAESYGMIQIRIRYHAPHLWPLQLDSSAFNLDYLLAVYRMVWHGYAPWLAYNTPQPGYSKYPATGADDVWGAVGNWFSGQWYDAAALDYVAAVKAHMAARDWERL